MNPDDEMNPLFASAVWQVRVSHGRPMHEDDVVAPLVLDSLPTVFVGGEEPSAPVHEVSYGPVLLFGDADDLVIAVPVSVTRHEVENQPETDLRSPHRTKNVRRMHRPTFAFCDFGIVVRGFEEDPAGSLTLATWEIQPFGVNL